MTLTRQVDNTIYSRKALAASREAYHEYCTVSVQPQSNGVIEVTVQVKDTYKEQARQVLLEFWNFFLDSSCKQHLESA